MLIYNCNRCGRAYNAELAKPVDIGVALCPGCVTGGCNYCGAKAAEAEEAAALHKKLDALAENFAQCRKGYDEWKRRAEAAEAGAAALREALEAVHVDDGCPACDNGPDGCHALATDAGAALLERLRKAESDRDGWRNAAEFVLAQMERMAASKHAERSGRLLRAAQSLHRRWNDQRAEHIDLQTSYEELEDERDALRSSLAACRKGNDEGTALLTAMTTERDEARERLRTLAVALRDLSPGPHPGPMDAEEYLPLVVERLRQVSSTLDERDALARGIAAMAADGLDIDDPTTAPTWTGKVLAKDGAVLFDLATEEHARPPSAMQQAAVEAELRQQAEAQRDLLRAGTAAIADERDGLRQRAEAAEALAGRWEQTEREAQKWSERCETAEEHIETLRQNSLAFHDKRRAQEARLSRLLRAAQSLHRAWCRERDLVVEVANQGLEQAAAATKAEAERDALRVEVASLRQTITVTATDEVQRRWREMEQERDALRAEVEALRADTNRLVSALMMSGDSAAAVSRRASVERERDTLTDEAEGLRKVAELAQALLERMDMDAGFGLLRFQTHEWGERVHYLRAALAATKGGG